MLVITGIYFSPFIYSTGYAYNIIKSLTKTFQPKTVVIKDENGNVLTESRQILDRWKRYCENMFANTSEPKQTAVDNSESYTDTELEIERVQGAMKLQQKWSKQAEKQGSPTIIKFAQKYGRQYGMARRMETSSVYYIT